MQAHPIDKTSPDRPSPESEVLNVYLGEDPFYVDGSDGEEYVKIRTRAASPNHQGEIHTRIKDLIPSETAHASQTNLSHGAQTALWNAIQPAYEAWKNGTEIPDHGHPVGTWPQIDRNTARVLMSLQYRTIEEVSTMDMETARRLMVKDGHRLPGLAKQFLENKSHVAQEKVIAAQSEQIAALEAKLAEVTALVAGTSPEAKAQLAKTDPPKNAFTGKPVVLNGHYSKSKTQACTDWGWTIKQFRHHEKMGTLDRLVDETIERMRADGRPIPGGDPLDRPGAAAETAPEGAGGSSDAASPPAPDPEESAARKAVKDDGAGGQKIDISELA